MRLSILLLFIITIISCGDKQKVSNNLVNPCLNEYYVLGEKINEIILSECVIIDSIISNQVFDSLKTNPLKLSLVELEFKGKDGLLENKFLTKNKFFTGNTAIIYNYQLQNDYIDMKLIFHNFKFSEKSLLKSKIALKYNLSNKILNNEIKSITLYFDSLPEKCICEWNNNHKDKPISNSGYIFEGYQHHLSECIYGKKIKRLDEVYEEIKKIMIDY